MCIMLFDRFVFVLYVLFNYAWFLLGCVYDTGWRFLPLISMCLSLLSVIVVTLLQLQRLVKLKQLEQSDRWSTVLWSSVHIMVCVLFMLDGFEWVNIMVVLCVAGLLLTTLIVVVGICSCYVIIQNSRAWSPHVHLTCLCFWVVVQYMSVRLPMDGLKYVTTVPVIAMAATRAVEHVEFGLDSLAVCEFVLWTLAVVLHVLLDVGAWTQEHFLWCLLASICMMICISRHSSKVCLLMTLPFVMVPLGLYTCFRYVQGYRSLQIGQDIMKWYDELTAAPPMQPFEMNPEDEDWETPL